MKFQIEENNFIKRVQYFFLQSWLLFALKKEPLK